MFGSVFGKRYNIDREIQTLYGEIATINGLKEMVALPAWEKLRGHLLGRVGEIDAAIVALAENPDKNGYELQAKHAFRTAITGLINAVETTLGEEHNILTKLTKLKTIRDAAPFGTTDDRTFGEEAR